MADQKLSALTELATTPASNDELYIRDESEAASAESKRITVANLMAAATGVTINTGTFSGNSSGDRAIAHGLGVVPKLVVMVSTNGTDYLYVKIDGLNSILGMAPTTNTQTAVTADTTTNFYVGNGEASGNGSGFTYYWVAIG